MKRKLYVLAVVVAVMSAVAAVWFYRIRSPAEPPRATAAVAVGAELAHEADVPVYINALGTVTPTRTVKITPQVSGVLLRTLVREGARVRKGQVIAEIDARELQARLKQAKGNLKRDQALLKNARRDLSRYQGALRDGSATQQAVDTQQTLVEQLEGTLMSDQGAIEELNVRIGYAHIRSPIDGRIGLRQIDPGNVLNADDAGSAVAVIESIRPTTVLFSIPEDQLPRLLRSTRSNRRVSVLALDREKKKTIGRGWVLAVDNRVDPATGTVNVKALFDNDDGRLYPNQFVNVSVQVDLLESVVIVPSTAVRRGRNGYYLFTVDQGTHAVLHSVEIGPTVRGYTVVRKGIAVGDSVVVEGADRLEDRMRVAPALRAQALPLPDPFGAAGTGRQDAAGPAGGPDAGADRATPPVGGQRAAEMEESAP